jgi:hypothetical protein
MDTSLHWIVQEGFFNETGMCDLVDLLKKYDIPHTIVKVIPFIGEVIPDINPEGNVICFGSYSMRHTAKKYNWYPGVFDLDEIADKLYTIKNEWTKHLLNRDSHFCMFEDVGELVNKMGLTEFFMRPVNDSKVFAGKLFSIEEYNEWRELVVVLEKDDGTSLRADTLCLVSSPKTIYAEYRLFVIGGEIVTSSQYKINDVVRYDAIVDEDILQFGRDRIKEQRLADAYCLDLCRTSDGIKIVEVNTINSAGFYCADVNKLVTRFEELYNNEV